MLASLRRHRNYRLFPRSETLVSSYTPGGRALVARPPRSKSLNAMADPHESSFP